MKIILDSNILFSALIKDSKARRIILEYEGFFLFPQYIFEEMEEHIEELLKKSKLPKNEFNTLLAIILKKVMIIPNNVLFPYRNKALDIVKDIDKDDILFVACALAYPNSII
ncbi:PIN domain nuclease [Candidatus Woesearchaeota archaeon]|nr:PIN domain nuclease [Candidatus Woesearchaeota archaeon]